MSLPTSPLRLLPTEATFVGWDSHPLEFRAFSRRTEITELHENSFWMDPTCQKLPYFAIAKTEGTGFDDRI